MRIFNQEGQIIRRSISKYPEYIKRLKETGRYFPNTIRKCIMQNEKKVVDSTCGSLLDKKA